MFHAGDIEVEDTHFATGEALCLAFGGAAFTAAHLLFHPPTPLAALRDAAPIPPTDAACMPAATAAQRESILDAVFSRAVSPSAPSRCAASVWLFCLLQFCASTPSVAARLEAAQGLFLQLLGDTSQLAQEVASRGLTAVHAAGDERVRERLVSALVGTLQGGAPAERAVKLDSDTQVPFAFLSS